MTKTLFHIGYPKCASTTLQKNLFALHPEIDNYGRFPVSNHGDEVSLIRPPRNLRSASVDTIYEHILHKPCSDLAPIAAILSKARQNALKAGRTVVFSDEGVLSTRFSDPDIERKAERLVTLFGTETRILIIFREQSALLNSLYADFPFIGDGEKSHKPLSFKEFALGGHPAQALLRQSLEYHRAGETYQELVGSKNLLMLPLELLARDPADMSRRIESFAGLSPDSVFSLLDGVQQNVSNYGLAQRYRRLRLRFINKNTVPGWLRTARPLENVLLKGLRYLDPSKGSKRPIDSDLALEIKALYVRSNRELQKLIGPDIDLNNFGYSTEALQS